MNSLTKVALAGAACGLAAVLMIVTTPLTSMIAGAVSVMMDQGLGSSWQVVPIFNLVPFLIIFVTYACLIGFVMHAQFHSDDTTTGPPLDEHGRPMKVCFSSRGGRFMWVPTSTTSDKEKP